MSYFVLIETQKKREAVESLLPRLMGGRTQHIDQMTLGVRLLVVGMMSIHLESEIKKHLHDL